MHKASRPGAELETVVTSPGRAEHDTLAPSAQLAPLAVITPCAAAPTAFGATKEQAHLSELERLLDDLVRAYMAEVQHSAVQHLRVSPRSWFAAHLCICLYVFRYRSIHMPIRVLMYTPARCQMCQGA